MSSFSPVSSHSPSIRPARSPTHSLSSNDSWDMSIRRLSTSLSKICHSPSTSCGDLPGLPDDLELHKTSPSNTTTAAPPLVKPRPIRRSLDETANRYRFSLHEQPAQDLYAAGEVSIRALYISNIGRMCKKLRIRHEQSRKKLHTQLALICGSPTSTTTTSMTMPHDPLSVLQEENYIKTSNEKPQRPVIRRESVKKGLKLDVDIGDKIRLHQLCVKLSPQEVEVAALPGFKPIKSEAISEQAANTDVEKIMCVMDGGILYIKQYPKKYLTIEYPAPHPQYQSNTGNSGTAQYFLPIMHQDDVARTWRLVFYIPGSYDTSTSRVLVKTVDDKLVICWCDGLGNGDRDRESVAAGSVCKLSMDLPHNVLTRSVSGVVTEDSQLVVEALLSDARDRCSSF